MHLPFKQLDKIFRFSTHKFQSAKVSFHSFCISCFFYFVVEVVAEVAEVRPSAEEVAEGEVAEEE